MSKFDIPGTFKNIRVGIIPIFPFPFYGAKNCRAQSPAVDYLANTKETIQEIFEIEAIFLRLSLRFNLGYSLLLRSRSSRI